MKAELNSKPTATPPASRMTLKAVKRGPVQQPLRLVLYGPPGIGKSTFAASAPSPVFLGGEKGTAQLDVARFPQPETWKEVWESIRALLDEEHSYQTYVVDTLDWIEPLCWAQVAKDAGKEHIEDIGYGKGFNAALDEWRLFLSRLERLSDAGINVVLLAHCHIRPFKNPEGEPFDRYEMKLHAKASSLIQEWADEVLFTNYETLTLEDKGRVRGVSSGARLVHTVRAAAFDAKNRHSLPAVLPLDWGEYEAAVQAQTPASAKDLIAAMESLLEGADAQLADAVRERIGKANGDASKLARLLNWLKAKTESEGGK